MEESVVELTFKRVEKKLCVKNWNIMTVVYGEVKYLSVEKVMVFCQIFCYIININYI